MLLRMKTTMMHLIQLHWYLKFFCIVSGPGGWLCNMQGNNSGHLAWCSNNAWYLREFGEFTYGVLLSFIVWVATIVINCYINIHIELQLNINIDWWMVFIWEGVTVWRIFYVMYSFLVFRKNVFIAWIDSVYSSTFECFPPFMCILSTNFPSLAG